MIKRNSMSIKDFVELVQYINDNHSMKKMEGECVKYISPIFDFRTNDIFCVKFYGGIHEDMSFSITNDNKDRDLKKWIYDWLEDRN